ncbi:hypothetical protein M427DRAFT_57567 [Gonapodya prolifera JEL478]|uniref:Uncharacterized protein n=1 Tax=Gonapodya prolifera (strain JEL478) TaxID=1344416 RepID=A0A139ACJ2_GONPJ|nr:hypothetical protein M427DRAFT_57567 [Gonapodya prolifera JEL478]|eukprot:KXS14389.1 hypothetical protein M427DRAFT_57567 [Gonapodya prolifera JEL478]
MLHVPILFLNLESFGTLWIMEDAAEREHLSLSFSKDSDISECSFFGVETLQRLELRLYVRNRQSLSESPPPTTNMSNLVHTLLHSCRSLQRLKLYLRFGRAVETKCLIGPQNLKSSECAMLAVLNEVLRSVKQGCAIEV